MSILEEGFTFYGDNEDGGSDKPDAKKRKREEESECSHCAHCTEKKAKRELKSKTKLWTHNGHCIELKPPEPDKRVNFEGEAPGWDLHLTIPHATVCTRLSSGTRFRFATYDIEKLGQFLKNPTMAINLNCRSGNKEELEIDGSQVLLIQEKMRLSVNMTPDIVKAFVQYLYDLTKDELSFKYTPPVLFNNMIYPPKKLVPQKDVASDCLYRGSNPDTMYGEGFAL
jgi:hypothetical protein